MEQEVSSLERSWNDLIQAEKRLKHLIGKSPSSANLAERSPLHSQYSRSKPASSYFGGILNNLNDPAKRPKSKRPYLRKRCRSKPFEISSTLDGQGGKVDTDEELNSTLLVKSYSKKSGGRERRQGKVKPVLTPVAAKLPLNPDIDVYGRQKEILELPIRRRRPTKMNQLRTSQSTRINTKAYVNTGADAFDPDTDFSISPMSLNDRSQTSYHKVSTPTAQSTYSPSTSPGRPQHDSYISMFLDHMVKEQAHKRFSRPKYFSHIRSPNSTKMILRGRSNFNKELELSTRYKTQEPQGEIEDLLIVERPGTKAVVKLPSYQPEDNP